MVVLVGADRVQLASAIGQGGAATVYAHPLRRTECIKIYTNPDEVEPDRIRFLIANPPPRIRRGGAPLFAWPLSAAYDEQTGLLVGFSMPRVQGVLPLTAIVDPGSCGPSITRGFRWKAAIAITRLVHTLHLMSPPHIVADVNLENFLVHRNGRVTAIDLDSTHFSQAGGPTYLCYRHRPEMQPPELVSAASPVIDREQDQDAYSVFILVHRLIREGIHPFDACYSGPGSPLRLHQRIEQGVWPDSLRHAEYRPKPGVVPFASLPMDLQDLFRRMFLDGASDRSKRPNVTELLNALEMHRPLGLLPEVIGRRAWRRELNPIPGAPSTLRRFGETCYRHRQKLVIASALAASLTTRVYFSGTVAVRAPHDPTSPPENTLTAPDSWAPPAPTPHAPRNKPAPPDASHQPPRQPALDTPLLWRLAEEAGGD